MACRCKYFIKILNNCCFCFSLRTGTLLFGCIFLVWFTYQCLGSAFMMECIFPNEYMDMGAKGPPAAPKTTMIFGYFGIIVSAMVCIGVHNNNELLFVPFFVFTPLWILVHIVAMILYNFVIVIVVLFVVTILLLIYAWIIVYSYFSELRYAYDEDLTQRQTYI
ncbi:uncharacterized protein LOC108596734 isoform X2 [Drosophila busckii]|uniref:uncharacterized protein LOC108596734 isoform X2 n=1 Tax=Drosophila busckii TaxID=30019 RepID=UPI00083EACAB|nr:uncharacterized protein LOC108596734 isoform X2 [Drosophila busckii]